MRTDKKDKSVRQEGIIRKIILIMTVIISAASMSTITMAKVDEKSKNSGRYKLTNRTMNYKAFNHTWKWDGRKWGTTLVPGIYKSYSSINADLDKEEEVILWEEDEFGLYRDLVKRSLPPGFFLIEITGYPVASFSAWMEENHINSYQNFNIGEDFNLLRSLGAGIQEPWSMSLFLGHRGPFWDLNENDELFIAATGVSGLVLTGGLYQLFENSFVESNWFRAEWKVKGSGGYGKKKRSWDLKTGYRWYGISGISNTATLVLKRTKTQKSKVDWRIFHNSSTSLELELPTSEIEDGFSRIHFSYGKYFPIRGKLGGLKLGVIYENRREYDPLLKEFSREKTRQFEFIIKPLLLF